MDQEISEDLAWENASGKRHSIETWHTGRLETVGLS